MHDAVDQVLAQWREQRPDLDVSPMGIIGRISRVDALIGKELARVFDEYDLQPGEFDLLATLRRSNTTHCLNVGELLRSTMVTSGAVTHRLNRLDEKQLITRELDPNNRRSIIVSLTRKGLDVVDRAVEAHVANERHQLEALTAKEQEDLATLLRKLLIAQGDGKLVD